MSIAYPVPDDDRGPIPDYSLPSLSEIYQRHFKDGWPDKGSVHSYIPVYEEILKPYRRTANNILEIGVLSGQSLLMWTEYFAGTVYGVDYTEFPLDKYDLRPLIEQSHKIKIFDATNEYDVKKHFEGVKFDLILEDCQHSFEQQIELYRVWKPYLNEGGIYVIEDVQDIDTNRKAFEGIDPDKKVEIVDLRKVKLRYDDVLIIIR